MKRYFTVDETVTIQYELRTTDEQEKEIDEKFEGSYQKWLEAQTPQNLFENACHNQIFDYVETFMSTISEG